MIKSENEKLQLDSNSILNRRKDYFSQLLNVHKDNDLGYIQVLTAKPLIPEPTLLEVLTKMEGGTAALTEDRRLALSDPQVSIVRRRNETKNI